MPGRFPFTAGVFPFKREGEDPVTESDLTGLVIETIRAMGHLAWRNAQLRRGRKHGGLGEGSPDVIACVTTRDGVGRFVGLEVKLPKGGVPVTEKQRAWLEVLAMRGGTGAVVRSVEETVAVVNGAAMGLARAEGSRTQSAGAPRKVK